MLVAVLTDDLCTTTIHTRASSGPDESSSALNVPLASAGCRLQGHIDACFRIKHKSSDVFLFFPDNQDVPFNNPAVECWHNFQHNYTGIF